jgi:hypothetical protein
VFQGAVYIVAAAIVVVMVSGVIAAVSRRARRFVLGRIGGAIYRVVTEDVRKAEQRSVYKQRNAAALQTALDDLGKSALDGMDAFTEEAAARVRGYCPQTRDAIDTLLAALRKAEHWYLDPKRLHPLLDAVRDAAAGCLEPDA